MSPDWDTVAKAEDSDYWDWIMDTYDPDGPHEEMLPMDLTPV